MVVQTEKPAAMVAVSEATKIKNKLREMANQAGAKAYERIGLAAQLMCDTAWIAEEFPESKDVLGNVIGGQHAALEWIETDLFGDLCGAMPLSRLLKMHTDVSEAEWKQHRYNIQRVAAALQEKQNANKPEREPVHRPGPKELAALQSDVDHWKAVAQTKEKEAKQVTTEVQKLRQELGEKKTEIAVLQGRVEELERMLDRVGIRQPA